MVKTLDELIKEYKLAKGALNAAEPRRMESHAAHDAWVRRMEALVKVAVPLLDEMLKGSGTGAK